MIYRTCTGGPQQLSIKHHCHVPGIWYSAVVRTAVALAENSHWLSGHFKLSATRLLGTLCRFAALLMCWMVPAVSFHSEIIFVLFFCFLLFICQLNIHRLFRFFLIFTAQMYLLCYTAVNNTTWYKISISSISYYLFCIIWRTQVEKGKDVCATD